MTFSVNTNSSSLDLSDFYTGLLDQHNSYLSLAPILHFLRHLITMWKPQLLFHQMPENKRL